MHPDLYGEESFDVLVPGKGLGKKHVGQVAVEVTSCYNIWVALKDQTATQPMRDVSQMDESSTLVT